MIAYRTAALPDELTAQVRATLKSPQYGHRAHVETATGYGPCRSCLDVFRTGQDERILFTFDPFAGLDDYPSPGPVFIHRLPCKRHPETSFPAALRHLPLALEGYGRGRWLVAREPATGDGLDAAIARLFAHPAIDYIHVRNGGAGCYIARLDRPQDPADPSPPSPLQPAG
ncbi:MAG: DUF1203 domain-containing protein [Acidobacteriota bacterium]|nr:DUF1203 domain-containing protein [Acidobacteriota bacterium]